MYKIDTELVVEACKLATECELPAVHYMVVQYERAAHLEKYDQAAMMELAIHKFVCYHNNYAVQK